MSASVSEYMRRSGLPAEPARVLLKRIDRVDPAAGRRTPPTTNGNGDEPTEEQNDGTFG